MMMMIMKLLLLLLLLTPIGMSPGGSGYFTCIQNTKLVTNKFKSGGLHEKHVAATWTLGKLWSAVRSRNVGHYSSQTGMARGAGDKKNTNREK